MAFMHSNTPDKQVVGTQLQMISKRLPISIPELLSFENTAHCSPKESPKGYPERIVQPDQRVGLCPDSIAETLIVAVEYPFIIDSDQFADTFKHFIARELNPIWLPTNGI